MMPLDHIVYYNIKLSRYCHLIYTCTDKIVIMKVKLFLISVMNNSNDYSNMVQGDSVTHDMGWSHMGSVTNKKGL